MNIPIKTNKLNYSLNKEAISNDYDVFCIKTTEKYFKSGAYIIDAPLLEKNVCSIVFEKGNRFHVMLKKNDMNKSLLKQTLIEAEGSENISLHHEISDEISDRLLLQLLLNSLSSYSSELLRCNNLTGHFYCFHPNWLVHKKKNGVDEIMQVPCMELKITNDFYLDLSIVTFTNIKHKNMIVFDKKPFKEYPQYVFSARNTLRRKLGSDQEPSFIKRQLKGQKSTASFLKLANIESFETSKMGLLASVMECFNEKLQTYAHIEFCEVFDYYSEDYTLAVKKENEAVFSEGLLSLPIKIIDGIKDSYSGLFCKEIQDTLKATYGVNATIGKRVSSNHYNIRLIHNEEFYNGKDDLHNRSFPDAVVQHVTLEDYQADDKFALKSVLYELMIKNDLKNGKLSMFDWKSFNFRESFIFGIDVSEDTNSKYAFMEIFPDGQFDISIHKVSLLEQSKFSDCINAFEDAKAKDLNIIGVIKDDNGIIYEIMDTGMFTVPELSLLKKELSRGNNKIRGKEKASELLSSCLDIKCFKNGKSECYFVGTKHKGIPRTINTASNIRKVDVYNGQASQFERILPMMNVSFVHNERLTVYPFPFKYLREWLKL